MNLQTELAPRHKSGLLLKNPVITASGTFGYGVEYARIAEVQRLGAIVCKGTTLHARSGNPHPRNLEGETIREFAQLAELLEGVPGVAGIEVNVSCPNVQAGGEVFGASAATVADVTTAVRRETTLPVIVKLSPNSGDARPTALAAASSGADAISLINTITSMGIDIKTRRPGLTHGTGGLSGPAIKPIALRMVYEVARELRLSYPHVPVIGIGGITNARDALEFIMAGASAIQIGTINFVNPHAGVEIIEGIEEFLRKEGVEDIGEIVGAALV